MMKSTFLSAVAMILASAVFAHDYTIDGIKVDHPVAFVTPKTARAGGGYLTITNGSDAADRLLEVRADFPRVMIHDTEMEGDVVKMVHLDGLDIPAGETVSLEPGGMHVMFMGLSDPFEEGQKIEATLVFENAGELEVVFNVEPRPEMGGMDHSNH